MAFITALMASVAACGGDDGSSATPPPPPPPPAPAPAPTPTPQNVTITINVTNTTAGATVAPVYSQVGDAAFTMAQLPTAYSCSGGPSPQTCTMQVPVGKTITIGSGEDAIYYVAITSATDPKLTTLAPPVEFVSWSAPCATPERGICVMAPTQDTTIDLVYGNMTPMLAGVDGTPEPFKVVMDAPPRAHPGSGSQVRQAMVAGQASIAFPDPSISIIPVCGGTAANPISICMAFYGPAASTISLFTLPLDPPPPVPPNPPSGPAWAFEGYGGGCGGSTSCTLTAGAATPPSAYLKWQYMTCLGDDGLVGGEYQPVTIDPDCTIHSP